ncbi:N-6 DNA methylase [Micromonospora sp. CA-111912]|uniref:N-6 DNA methylase n=1 Tax=Micromonospora sp. CA-111912 TaxID=3239955 RepID=UPI003D94D1A2
MSRIADRDRLRSEATLQADVRQLLLTGGLNLSEHDMTVDLETQVGDGRRIDVEVGFTVIEIKKDLSSTAALRDAIRQLTGYVKTRTQQTAQRYVGVLTDGADWRAYHLNGDVLKEVNYFRLTKRTQIADLLLWLEEVLATTTDVKPTPMEIRRRLGADSVSYSIDIATLTALYDAHKDLPTVQMKRQLWSELLRSALGTQFTDDDSLFVEHTLLVNTAEIIAHLVLGLPVRNMEPASLLIGETFNQAQLYGVIEADFFDWVIEVPEGDGFVRAVARRLARFDWADVDHDVLKVLYESIISTATRKAQGEYYTPDWLAESVVSESVTDPLQQRVLDPSCGSGTFLFHAARRYLAAAEAAGTSLKEALHGLTNHVAGIDLHPVAVALARVTYLLAIGRDRLNGERGPIRVPVFLGDSVQWDQRLDLIDHGHLVVRTDYDGRFYKSDLRFPEDLLADVYRFDDLVNTLADLAADQRRVRGTVPSLVHVFRRLAIEPEHHAAITQNLQLLCELVDHDRNHIWSYYVRNLARPMWLSRPENRVDVLVGNPPWLSYRHMPAKMQERFKEMSQERGLWKGFEVATHQDLSGLFIARSVQQYLTDNGTFGFVVPNPVLDRPYWTGFRSGAFHDPSEIIDVAFTHSWDLRRLRPHFFPRGSAVIFGHRTTHGNSKPLPRTTQRWTGTLPRGAARWEHVESAISRAGAELVYASEGLNDSPYRPRFANGATIYPRLLFFVERQEAGPLGLGAGRVKVRSDRSTSENPPWKALPDLDGVVESEFVRPIYLSECVLPYRTLPPRYAILPLQGTEILDGRHRDLDRYPDLARWWRHAEELWLQHRSSDRLTLTGRLNYQNDLIGQLPGTALRVVYGKSGMHVSAALIDAPNGIIEHSLYWATVTSRSEGLYLLAILNAPAITELVRPLLPYAKDERHIDRYVWELPIPTYDNTNPRHLRLAEIGQSEMNRIAALDLDTSKHFVALRKLVRQHLLDSPDADELDLLVRELLD